jgi:hypothetical protein
MTSCWTGANSRPTLVHMLSNHRRACCVLQLAQHSDGDDKTDQHTNQPPATPATSMTDSNPYVVTRNDGQHFAEPCTAL